MVMDVWGWIAVYAVGLTLLQLLVYRYLLNSRRSMTRRVGTPFGDGEADGNRPWSNGSSGSTERPASSRPSERVRRGESRPNTNAPPVDAWPAAEQSAATAPDGSVGRPCDHCGAVNEADETFDHCWNCARPL
jgi:hypothetical protein